MSSLSWIPVYTSGSLVYVLTTRPYFIFVTAHHAHLLLKMEHFAVLKSVRLGTNLEIIMLQSSHKDCGSISSLQGYHGF